MENPMNDDIYTLPSDVAQKLEHWQDLKFGLMIHWGLYSQLGVVESWGLCREGQDFQESVITVSTGAS